MIWIVISIAAIIAAFKLIIWEQEYTLNTTNN